MPSMWASIEEVRVTKQIFMSRSHKGRHCCVLCAHTVAEFQVNIADHEDEFLVDLYVH